MSILSQLDSSKPDTLAATIKNPFRKSVKNPGEKMPDFNGGFTIVEYVNGVPQDATKLTLNGNMMPFQPFPWDGEQRLNKQYYPGNPEPAVHVMGAKEGELVIRGRFKDKRYDETKIPYGISYQFSQALDAMRRRGNLVKFGMAGNIDPKGAFGNWFRYGFLEKTSFKMNKLSWIEYELTFFVVSEKQPINNYFAAPEKTAPDSVNQKLLDAASTFQSLYSAIPTSMPQSLAGFINDQISTVATAVNLVTNFVGSVISTAEDVAGSANRALGLIKNARTQVAVFQRRLGGLAHTFSTLSVSSTPSKSAAGTYHNLSHINSALVGVGGLAAFLAAMQSNFEKISKSVPKGRHKVQQGDTLQNISVKYYGTADNWNLIYNHNKLTTTVLVPGRILEIPKA